MNNTPFESATDAAKHIRKRLKVAGINASVRSIRQFGGAVNIQPAKYGATFSDGEQDRIIRILSVNKFAHAGHYPWKESDKYNSTGIRVPRGHGFEGYLQTY